MPSVILDHRLYVPMQISGIDEINRVALSSPGWRAHVANQLVAFDTVLVPTMDFAVVSALAEWMGHGLLVDLLSSDALRFVRRPSILTYAGNGGGINLAKIEEVPESRFPDAERCMWGSLEDSLYLQLRRGGLSDAEVRTLMDAALPRTTEYHPSSNEAFIEQVEHQSYYDILNSDSLKAQISDFDKALVGDGPIDLKRLPSVAPNQVETIAFDPPTKAAHVVLQVAEANLELLMGAECWASDIYTREPTDIVLSARMISAGAEAVRGEGVVRLFDLVGIPDLGAAIDSGNVSFQKIADLRESAAGRQFRSWLDELDPTEPRDIQQAVIDDLLAESRVGNLGARVLRLAATTGLAVLNPAAGAAAAVADGLVAERFVDGWRPRVFMRALDDLTADTGAT